MSKNNNLKKLTELKPVITFTLNEKNIILLVYNSLIAGYLGGLLGIGGGMVLTPIWLEMGIGA